MQVQTLTIPDGVGSLPVSGVEAAGFKAISWRGNDLLVQMQNGNVLLFKGAHATRIAGKNPLLVFDDLSISLNHFSGPAPEALAPPNSSALTGNPLRDKAKKKPSRPTRAEKIALEAENALWVSEAFEHIAKENAIAATLVNPVTDSTSSIQTAISSTSTELTDSLDSKDLSAPKAMADTPVAQMVQVSEPLPTSSVMASAGGNWVFYALGAGVAGAGLSGKKNKPTNPDPVADNATPAAANRAPSGSDKTLAIAEDSSYTLLASDFGFIDASGDNNALKSITITALPAAGTLQLNWVNVITNQVIPVAALSGLQFKPASNANGNAYSSIKFKLTDDGGTVDGGADTSTEKTLTFNVSSVDDAPTAVGTVPTQSGQVASVFTTLNLSPSFTDVDAGNQFSYAVTSGTLPVGLALNQSTGTISGTPTAASTAAVTVTATDSGGLTAVQSFNFNLLPVTITPPLALDTAVPSWISSTDYAINTSGLSITNPSMGIASLISNDGLDTASGLITPQIQASWLPMTVNDTQRPTGRSSAAALSLSYAFQDTGALYQNDLNDSNVEKSVQANMSYTPLEKAFVREVYANFASFANLVFTENTGANSQQYANAGGADIRLFKGTFAEYGVTNSTLGFAYQPGQYNSKTVDNSGNFFLVTNALAYPKANAFGFAYGLEKQTVTHELGHALGLDHPFANTALALEGWYGEVDPRTLAANRLATVTGGSYDTPLTDTPQESLMSYYKPFEAFIGISNALLPAQSEVYTPWKAGVYDIAALQHLYGANMSYNTTDTVYSYDGNIPVFDTIWDARGNDTLTQLGNQAAVIDLRGGDHMSRMGLFSGAKYVFSETILETDLKGTNTGRADITGMKAIYTSGGVVNQVGYLSRTNNNSEWTYLTDPTMPTGLAVELIATFDFYDASGVMVANDQTRTIANLPKIGVVDSSMGFNVGIAFGVVIENAVGGDGNDVIWGNAAANRMTTGAGTDRVKYDLGGNINGDTLTDFTNVDLLDLSALRLTTNQQTQINWDASSNRLTYIDPVQAANSWSLTINGSFSTAQLVLA